MSNYDDFFTENAFGDIYSGTFFEDDFPKCPPKNLKRSCSTEDAQCNEATNKVRMSNEVDVSQQVTGKLNSMYSLGGNLGGLNNGMMTPTFNGIILGGI